MQPSTVMELNEAATASCSAFWRVGASTAASVVQRASIVAMLGASMAAPLAIPPTVKPGPATTTSFGTVSVVMMARAAAAPASFPSTRACTMAARLGSTVSIGNEMPMRPVWQMRICAEDAPMPPATAAHTRSAASRPAAPVAAFALPDVSTTPAALPLVAARWVRLTWTGAAAARFEVNTPAHGTAWPSAVATTATSSASFALMPADPPAATKPLGAVTLTGRALRSAARSSRSGPVRRSHTGWPGPRRP